MSHIVIDAREYTTTSGRYTYRLVQYLQQTKSEHEYTILLKPSDMNVSEFTNPRFHKLACPYKEFTFAEQLGLLRQIRALKPDLVHFAFVQQPILYRGPVVTTMQDLTTLRFRNPTKNPVVFTAKQQVYRMVNQVAARKSAALITPTQFVKDDIVKFAHVSPDKITVTLEAADPIPDTPEAVPELSGAAYLMYVGRPLPHKNLGRLIEAFAVIKRTAPELKLVLVGKRGALHESHAARARELGLESDLIITGFVSEGQLRWLYENCRAYVFPSLSEGFGLPPLEAMIHGAPVVASNATCIPEVCGEAAHYFDPLDVDDIARAITDVLNDTVLRADLIARGYEQAKKYSWKRMAEQTLAVYNKILA